MTVARRPAASTRRLSNVMVGEALHVEEVGAAQVRVAEADARVDRRRLDRQADPRGREVARIDDDVAAEAVEAPVGVHEARRRPESELAGLGLDA